MKELMFFNGHDHVVVQKRGWHCDPPPEAVERYWHRFPAWGPSEEKNGKLMTGEWSASYLSAPCAASAVRRLLPEVRLIVIARQPVRRAVSRFQEQSKAWQKTPTTNGALYIMHKRLELDRPVTWDEYVRLKLPPLRQCLARADAGEHTVPADSDARAPGLDAVVAARADCAYRSNIFGWSLYNLALRVWLHSFPKEQMLVLYTEDLEAEPEAVLKSIEQVGSVVNPKSTIILSGKQTVHCERFYSLILSLSNQWGGGLSSPGPFVSNPPSVVF